MRGESLVVAAKPHQDPAPGGMSVGQARIQRQRPFGGRQARFLRFSPHTQAFLANRKQRPGAGVVGVDLQCAPAEANRYLDVLDAKF